MELKNGGGWFRWCSFSIWWFLGSIWFFPGGNRLLKTAGVWQCWPVCGVLISSVRLVGVAEDQVIQNTLNNKLLKVNNNNKSVRTSKTWREKKWDYKKKAAKNYQKLTCFPGIASNMLRLSKSEHVKTGPRWANQLVNRDAQSATMQMHITCIWYNIV